MPSRDHKVLCDPSQPYPVMLSKIYRLFFILFFVQGWAQEYVTLQVTVQMNGQPVEGATVSVREAGKEKVTDNTGTAVFRLSKGNYEIIVSYNKIVRRRKINLDKDKRLVIRLTPAGKLPVQELPTVTVNVIAAEKNMPVAQNTLSKKQLTATYTAEDVPFLLDELPSTVVSSDAGLGTGYTSVRIRGIGPQNINVTLNGIPLNDPESQTVYWVDIPDFTSSTSRLQVQRGLGTSTFGTGSFGANINLQTEGPSRKPFSELSGSYGSFNTYRATVKFGTGLINRKFGLSGRLSRIGSDGYIDRASSDLKSYFLSAAYLFGKGNQSLRVYHFGGHEKTYQAWYGVDKETFDRNPGFNYAGAIYDDSGNIKAFYDNQVDDYTQKHTQLHYSARLNDWKIGAVLHYTKGYGYYEEYEQNQDFDKYGLSPVVIGNDTIRSTDLIRRKWLDNDFFGGVLTATRRSEKSRWYFGTGWNRYIGKHFGRVIWARYASGSEIRHTYYNNTGDKQSFNAFVKNLRDLGQDWTLFTDLQIRGINYEVHYDPQKTFDPGKRYRLTDKLFFFNPKIGIQNTRQGLYAYIAQAWREPTRTDYLENPVKPKPERLIDIEGGWKNGKTFSGSSLFWHINLYGMLYRNQLAYTGKIDNVGNPIRENVGRSYRTGVEIEGQYNREPVKLGFSATLSRNKIIDYTYYNWDTGQTEHFGNTDISFSPSIIASFSAEWHPAKNLAVRWRSKYVGKQYMDNRNIPSSVLPAYLLHHAGIRYTLKPAKGAKEVNLKLQIKNIFNKKYASNGYMWGDTPYYFPQAGRYFLAGVDILFR